MAYKNYLSDLYQLYIEGELPKKELECGIFQYLLSNNGRYRVFDRRRDCWDEFISWLYPKLARAVDRYRDLGSTFDAYIAGLVIKASKEYRRREAAHYITERACWRARTEDMIVSESEPGYSEQVNGVSIPEGMTPRQILLLLLKFYYCVSDEMINRVAGSTGLDAEEIRNLIGETEKRCSPREIERLKFRDRVYCQHYRCLVYEKRMKAAEPGTLYYERLKDRVERARKRFYSMNRRLGKMRVNAPNRIIAEVIGVPKGTIDSALFALKHRFILGCVPKRRKRGYPDKGKGGES